MLANVTLAGNEASSGNGGGVYPSAFGTATFTNSIVADNAGGACAGAGAVAAAPSHHNLATDGSCALHRPRQPPGHRPRARRLWPTTAGPTDTRALARHEPGDERRQRLPGDRPARRRPPQGGGLRHRRVRVRRAEAHRHHDRDQQRRRRGQRRRISACASATRPAPTSPAARSPASASGTTYTLAPGSFSVSADGPNLYTLTIGGACSAAGAVALGENQTATCTITANDRAPRAGREVGAIPAGGTVRIKKPGGRFHVLREGDILPNGTIVDTLKGRITLIAAANKSGKETKADFYDGIFKLSQTKGRRPITTLTLIEKLTCPKAGNASAAAKKKRSAACGATAAAGSARRASTARRRSWARSGWSRTAAPVDAHARGPRPCRPCATSSRRRRSSSAGASGTSRAPRADPSNRPDRLDAGSPLQDHRS